MNFYEIWLLGYRSPSRLFEELKSKPAPMWGIYAVLIRSVLNSLLLFLPLHLLGREPSVPSYLTFLRTESEAFLHRFRSATKELNASVSGIASRVTRELADLLEYVRVIDTSFQITLDDTANRAQDSQSSSQEAAGLADEALSLLQDLFTESQALRDRITDNETRLDALLAHHSLTQAFEMVYGPRLRNDIRRMLGHPHRTTEDIVKFIHTFHPWIPYWLLDQWRNQVLAEAADPPRPIFAQEEQ